jgi:hypothetical protein
VKKAAAAQQKRSYHTPTLQRFGRVRELTTGGSGNAQESSSGTDPTLYKKRP